MAEDLDWGDQPDYRQPVPAPTFGSKLPPLARDAIERAREKLAEAKNNPLCNFGVGAGTPEPLPPAEEWPVHEQQEADFVSATPADGDPVEEDPGYEQAAAGSLKLGDQVWVGEVWRKVAGIVVDPPPSTTQVYWDDQDPEAEPYELGADEIVYVTRG